MGGETYTIRSVVDFLTVPEDRRDTCLREFAVWLSLLENGRILLGEEHVKFPDAFGWIDDGLHEAVLAVETPDGEQHEIVRGRMKGFDHDH